KLKTLFLTVTLFGLFNVANAQNTDCDINTFTATGVNGICYDDGSIEVALVPPGTDCFLVFAELFDENDLPYLGGTVLPVDGTGSATFLGLRPGEYYVRLGRNVAPVGIAGPILVTLGIDDQLVVTCPTYPLGALDVQCYDNIPVDLTYTVPAFEAL